MASQRVGYIGMSSLDQSTERQLEGIALDEVVVDKASRLAQNLTIHPGFSIHRLSARFSSSSSRSRVMFDTSMPLFWPPFIKTRIAHAVHSSGTAILPWASLRILNIWLPVEPDLFIAALLKYLLPITAISMGDYRRDGMAIGGWDSLTANYLFCII